MLTPNPKAEHYSRSLFAFVVATRQLMHDAPMEARAARGAADVIGCTIVNDKPPLIVGQKASVQIKVETLADIYAASMTLLVRETANPEEQSRFVGRLIHQLLGQLAQDPAHPLHQDYLATLPPQEEANGAANDQNSNN